VVSGEVTFHESRRVTPLLAAAVVTLTVGSVI
jgi:hypothetical protein